MDRQVAFRVFRFDPQSDSEPRFDTFTVEAREGMNVLEGLFYILENLDGSLAFRFSCRGAVCGSCAMFINGAYRLACKTMLRDLKEVTISPLGHLPVIKDLVVDMRPFYRKYESILPYLLPASEPPLKEYPQSPKQRHAINEMIDCILCGCCHAACPIVWTNKDYLGPAALTKAYRFVADSRDGAENERLALVSGPDGIWRCHTIFNCHEVCPKYINPTYSIQQLKRMAISRRLHFWRKNK
ncbi:MAG: succinate dehydrogenase iron-sulfur subunit [Chloroflexi bacterium]|nr:succinate dehydrogenase iron-sulfur subunit [Chloroflexota bacterium]